MGVSTVRANATVQQGAFTTLVGGASAHAVLGDAVGTAGDADGTAVDITASGYDATRGVILDLPAFTIPASARITGVRIRFRARDNSSFPFDSLVRAKPRLVSPFGTGVYQEGVGVASNWGATTMTYYVGAYEVSNPFGVEWTTADLGNLQVLITAQTQFFGSGGRVSEVWVDAQYDEQPSMVVTAPAEAAALATSMPTVGFTYSDPDGSPLASIRVKVFSSAQYGAGGFDPETSAAMVDSGWVGSTNPGAYSVTTALTNGSYRAYAKARHSFGSGYFESPWDFNTFTINVTPPPTPTVTITPNTSLATNTVTALRGGTTPATEAYDFESSDDGGATWVPLRYGSVAGAGTQVQTIDHEAPPNVARRYRARAWRTAGGFRLYSDWSAVVLSTLAVSRWWLFDATASTNGVPVVVEGDTFSHASEEQSQVLYPLGRRNPVVISGKIQGETYDMTLVFASEIAFLEFEAIRNSQRVLLLKSARNWQRYLKLVGGRGVAEDRTTADVGPWWYTVTVSAVEQDRP